MRKLTLFIATLLLTVAKTVAFEVSTSVTNPEHLYFITNGNNVKVGKNAVNSNEAGCFAFYAVEDEDVDNAYYIYSLDEKKWFDYEMKASYGGTKNFVKLSEKKGNYFYIESCANNAGFYQIRPYKTTGVASIYLNYFQGVDGSSTIGLWTADGAADAGSRWNFIEAECVYEIGGLSNDKVYNLTTTRGWLIYNESNANQVSSTASYKNFTTGKDVEACQWAIYKSEKTAKYYLYNIGAGKFVGKNSDEAGRFPFVATVTNDIQVVKSTTGTSYALVFSTDNYGAINHFNHTAAPGVANWKGNANEGGLRALGDAGSAHRVVEVGTISNETLATIAELVAVYETLPELDAAIAAAEGKAAWVGEAVGLYSYTGDYAAELQSIKDFREAIDENTTLTAVQEKIESLTAMSGSLTLNTPQTGKYYRLKNAVSNRYMSANSEGNGVVVIDNGAEAASTIFYLEEGNVFRSYTRNLYLDCGNKNLSSEKNNGLFAVAYDNNPTANTITYKNHGYWVFGNREDGVSIDRGSSSNLAGYNWIIEEVTELPVAKIGETAYYTFAEALEATKTMTGDVTVEIYDKVTFNQPLIGNYTSINFVGKDTDAEMYLDVQGYTTATGKKVSFTDLKLSKSQGGFIANAGFMNVAFGIYDVEEVTYTNCTFENGACASSGKVTFNGCTFKKSWDKYGLWAYGNVDVTVQGSTFADYRGIKMYAENGADASVEKANLTVKNTNFSAVDSKPAIVLTYGESVVLEGNTYSSTGTFELDLDGKPNGVAVTSDVAPVCKNDNGACGVLVDGKIYTTVAQAAEVATSGSTVTLLHNSTETVELAEGVVLDKNGFEAVGVTVYVKPPVAKIGDTPYYSLAEALADAKTKNLSEVVITIIGENTAATADNFALYDETLFNNVTLKQENGGKAYYINELHTGSRTDNGEFVFDGVNIVVTGQYINQCKTVLKNNSMLKRSNDTKNFIMGDMVIEPGSKYDGQIDAIYAGSITVDGGKTDGTYNAEFDFKSIYFESYYPLIVKNGAYVVMNAANEIGTWTLKRGVSQILASKLEVFNTITLEAAATLVLDAKSIVTAKAVTGAGKITIDATGMVAGDVVNFTANLSQFTGTLSVINNDKLEAQIVDGKVVLAAKPVAKIGEQGYATIEAAFKAATSGCTIDILSDVTVDYKWDARYTGAKFTVPVTINGNDKTIKFTNTVYDGGNNMSAFRFEADATVNNLTIDMSEAISGFAGRFRAISAKANLTVDGCTFIGNGSTNNTRAIIFGEGAGANAANLAIAITNSTFNGWKRGISDNENAQDVKTVTITGNTLTDAGVGVSAKETVTFTGNTVAGAYVNIKSYTAGNKLAVTATGNTLEPNTDGAYNVIDAGGVVNAEGFNVVAKGNNFTGYVETQGIWGEVWGNARESFEIKVLDANGNVMGTSTLNNIGGIINGNVNVTWHLYFDAAANTDEYWTMKWTTAPSISNMPAKVALWVDGVEVSGGNVVLNGPDNLWPIAVAVTDENGVITSCHATIADAVAANATNIALLRETTEEIKLPFGVTLDKNGFAAGNVTETLPVVKIGDTGYPTFAAALAAVEDGQTITLIEGITGDEKSTDIEYTKAISFTITGKAPQYALPVVTFQNAKVTIKDAEILIPELDARQNAVINVVNTIVHDAGGNSIAKSYYNGTINIDKTSTVYMMQITTMGYINVAGTVNASWQTNVYGNGMISLAEGATFNTGALHLTGKDYSGRDNTDEDRVGKPATIVVDAATLNVGKVKSDNGSDYSYNSKEGINVGTVDGKSALLDVKNGGAVNFHMANGQTTNFGAGATVNVASSTLKTICRDENGTVTLANAGNVVVTGNSQLDVKNYSGNAIQLNNGNLVDTYFAGRVDAFGTNNILGTTTIGGILSLGYGTNPTEQVVVNITGNFNGTNVLVSTNNGVDNILNVGKADGERTTVHFGQLGAFADVNVVNADVTYGYAFIRNDFNATNSTFEIKGGANTYFAGNAKVVLDNTTWNLPGYANIGSYGGYMYGNADVTLKNGSSMTATSLGIEVSGENVVKLTLEDNSSFTATKLTNQGSIVLASTEATLTSNECANVTTSVPNKVVSYKDGKYTLLAAVAKIGDKYYTTLQAAIDAVQNGETITLTDNVAGNVTLTEKVGLYYTIDGASKKMNGTITLNSLSDTEDNRRITIKNINFVDETAAQVGFIAAEKTNHYPRLTVEGCTFTGSGDDKDVAVRLKTAYGAVIKNCTGTGLHSFLQNTAGLNLTIENVTVTGSKSGFALGTVQGVTVKGCKADVKGYGIRLDANTYNNNAVIKDNTISAFIPVVVRNANTESNITVEGTNTMTATNTDGLWFAAGISEYEKNGELPTPATGQVKVALTDTGLDAAGIYGSYYDSLVIHVGATQTGRMVTRDIYVATMDEAVAEAKAINAGAVIYKVYGEVELTTGGSHGILDLGKNVVIEGADATAKLTIVGGGVPDIKGVTFKNIILADEGTYLPTANEFMYQNYIDCTFENVTFVDGIRLSGTSTIKDSKVDANTANEYAIWLDEGEFTMTGTTVVGGADAYGLVKSDNVSKITITDNTFQYLGEANKEALNIKGAVVVAENNKFIDCTKGVLPADKTNYTDDSKTTVATDATIAENNKVAVYHVAIGEQMFETLAAAIKAAKAGDEITLLRDVKENVTFNKNLTLNGAGKTITGMITTDGKSLKVTIKNVNFDGDNGTIGYAMRADDNLNLVVDNCSASNYLYGLLYANKSNDKIVVKNVTVENCAEYGAYLVAFNKATFENFTVKGNTKYGIAVANSGARTVNLKNVTFEGAEQPLHINEIGTGKVTFNFSGSNDMSKAEFYTSQYVKVVAAAQVGTKVCGSLNDAFAAAQTDDTVKMLSNLNLGWNDVVKTKEGYDVLAIVENKNIVLDMNEKKISVNHQSTTERIYSVLFVENGAGLTVTGNGSIDIDADDNAPKVAYMFWKRGDTGYIVIENGNYHADNTEDSMVYTNGSNIVTVNGGTFILDANGTRVNGFPWIFNVVGNDAGYINVYGGTYNYDIRKQYYANEVNLGEGLTTTYNGDDETWTVVPAVATVGEETFGSIQEAIDAAQDGETVKLIADVVYTDADVQSVEEKPYTTMLYVQGKNITLDLNGKNIDVTYTGSLLYSVVLVSDGAGLTVTGEGSINAVGLKADGTAAKNIAYVFWKRGETGYLTIENGTFHMNDAADSMVYTNGDEIVTINGGTFTLDAVASQDNGFPVLFNAVGNNERQIVVNGGTFNYDINHQIRPFEPYVAPEKAVKKVQIDGVDMWTIVPAEAYVTEMLGAWVTEPGDNEHKVGYATVAEAIAATNNLGKTVTVVSDATMSETAIVAADKNITLDLNGKVVSMENASTAAVAMIKNEGNLTIVDNSEAQNGKISFKSTTPSASNAYASNTISNYGTLTINAGTIENLSTGGACYALDNYAGSTATINGGELNAEKTAVRIFNWTDGEAAKATLNMNGGEIYSKDGYGINVNSGNAPYVALNISSGTITTDDTDYNLAVYVVNKGTAEHFTANVTDGTFNGFFALNGVTATTMAKGAVSVTGGTFDGVICYADPAYGFISGEETLFKSAVPANYCAANWGPYSYGDGIYGVEYLFVDKLTIVDGEYEEFENQNAKTVGTLTYERTLNTGWNALYVPFEIPVDVLTALGYEAAFFYDVHFEVLEGGEINPESAPDVHLIKIKKGTLKANFPYVIRASQNADSNMSLVLNDVTLYSTAASEMNSVEAGSTINRFIFAGTYTKATREQLTGDTDIPCYAITPRGTFQKMSATAKLTPFRVFMYIVAKDGSPVILNDVAAESIQMRVIGEENEDGTTFIYDVENDVQTVDYIYDLQGRRVLEPQKGNLYIINGKKVIF